MVNTIILLYVGVDKGFYFNVRDNILMFGTIYVCFL